MSKVLSVAAKLRERDAIRKSGMRQEVIDKLVAQIDAEIEEVAAQLSLKSNSIVGADSDSKVAKR